MTEKRISLWSGPRNVSTALMYSFAQRPDTKVIDEPLYGHYLSVSGAQHPGRNEILDAMELNEKVVIKDICESDFGRPIVFIKNMAHHLLSLDLDFLQHFQNVLLIREPREMIPSLINQIPHPTMRDTGLQRQWELYQYLKEKNFNPMVIDSKALLLGPESMLRKLCNNVDIPYYTAMTGWNKGPIPEDGVWAKYWYQNVHISNGFQRYKQKNAAVPDHLTELLEKCEHYYQLLLEHSAKVTD